MLVLLLPISITEILVGQKSERFDRSVRSKGSESFERSERSIRSERSERVEKSERSYRVERSKKSERSENSEEKSWDLRHSDIWEIMTSQRFES